MVGNSAPTSRELIADILR